MSRHVYKVGDKVEILVGDCWYRAAVEEVLADTVIARREGKNLSGSVYSRRRIDSGRVRPLTEVPPGAYPQGNIFADWLEENDEPRAAAKLREAFPMADAQLPPTKEEIEQAVAAAVKAIFEYRAVTASATAKEKQFVVPPLSVIL
jgi:hypothetical protein